MRQIARACTWCNGGSGCRCVCTPTLLTQEATTIDEVQARLATQRRLLAGAQALSHATDNRDVIQRAQADVRHLQQSIEYLEENLRALQRRSSLDVVSVPASQSAGSGLAVDPAAPTAADERRGSVLPPGMPIDSSAAYRGVFVDTEAAAAAPAPARQ